MLLLFLVEDVPLQHFKDYLLKAPMLSIYCCCFFVFCYGLWLARSLTDKAQCFETIIAENREYVIHVKKLDVIIFFVSILLFYLSHTPILIIFAQNIIFQYFDFWSEAIY